MKAVILSGGFGTRMRPLTFTRPKPLLPLLGIPMVDHIVDSLPREVDEVIMAANYLIEQLRDHFEERNAKARSPSWCFITAPTRRGRTVFRPEKARAGTGCPAYRCAR